MHTLYNSLEEINDLLKNAGTFNSKYLSPWIENDIGILILKCEHGKQAIR